MVFTRAGSGSAAMLLWAVLLCMPFQPAYAFWGVLGKLGSAAGKTGATAGTKVGVVGKGAAVGVGAEGAAAGGLLDDAARGIGKTGAADAAMTANAALPPEVAHYLSKPTSTLTVTDTANMMTAYQKMIRDAGRSGDFTVVERLPNTSGTGKTLPHAGAPANTPGQAKAAATPAKPVTVPPHAVQLLLHAAKAGNHTAQSEVSQRCAAFRKQGKIPKEWQEACRFAT